jgi:ABC-2 type transport system permease protein
VRSDLASTAAETAGQPLSMTSRAHYRNSGQIAAMVALARAGFRRYSTYRQATVASIFTNSTFGFLRCYVLLAAAASAPRLGIAGGYDAAQLATYCWASQGLIGMVMLWGWTELSDRIRTGDVLTDLLRPVHPVLSYLAVDLGRAAHASLTRLLVPMLVGATFFTLYVPHRPATYPLLLMSVVFAVVVSFGCRYLVNAAGYWLLETRGINLIWTFATAVLAGLSFPLHFLPSWLVLTLWVATPFPSILQAPLDVLVEYGSTGYSVAVTAGQAVWVVVLLTVCWQVQRRADRKLVIQGG